MRTFAPTQQPAHLPTEADPARAKPSPPTASRHASPLLRVQGAAGNRALGQFVQAHAERADSAGREAKSHTPRPESLAAVARGDSVEESQAGAAGERARHSPPDGARALTNDAGGFKAVSEAGRRYFEPLVGPGAGRARLHVDARAERLAQLAGAQALTYGDDVFIPRERFAPWSAEGRALLGHELAHVAQHQTDRPRLFRQPTVEPHYPTVSEQKEIAKLLKRERQRPAAAAAAPQPAPQPAAGNQPENKPEEEVLVEMGRALDVNQRRALAARLEGPFFDKIDEFDTGRGAGAALDKAEAFEEVGKARASVLKKYGKYTTRPINLTQDASADGAARRAAGQVLVVFDDIPEIVEAFARTIIETHCETCKAELEGLNDESKEAVIEALVGAGFAKRREQLRRAARENVGGSHSDEQARVYVGLRTRDKVYGTAVHELIHHLAHPAFHAAFIDERHIIEGFTEYFTREVVSTDRTSYKEVYEKISDVRSAMSVPLVGTEGAEESMRLAYFGGRLELIGWKPSGPAEKKAVEEAGGSAQWEEAKAQTYPPVYHAQTMAAQKPSWNVLGVGFYFNPKSAGENTVNVSYARVLARTGYAQGQLFAEGQFFGGPVDKPSKLGASLGLGLEWQRPYFYVQAGVRVVGTAALDQNTGRLDAAPFAGLGIRAWQPVRVGVGGFVLLPLAGADDKVWNVGGNVSVEFK